MYKIVSEDLSAFVYGRKILKQNSTAHINFFVQNKNLENISKNFFIPMMQNVFEHQTKFGRIGIMYGRKNNEAKSFLKTFNVSQFNYTPTEKRASTELKPKITKIENLILCEMANEGLSDTVEFRRLARRQLRPFRHANVDTIVCFDDILAEEKTRKILHQIIGKQKKLIFPIDSFVPEIQPSKQRVIEINAPVHDKSFILNRASKILQTQIRTL